MSMTDPIADLLTRIRNAQLARKPDVSVSSSKLKTALVKVLKDEGYVAGFQIASEGVKQTLTHRAEVLRRPPRDRPPRARVASRPAYLPQQERAAEDPGRSRYRDRLHAEGRDDGQTGAGHRAGRRSPLHRGLTKETQLMSRVAKRPVDLPQGVTATVAANTIKVKGAKGELTLVVADGVSVEQKEKNCWSARTRATRAACRRARRARTSRTW